MRIRRMLLKDFENNPGAWALAKQHGKVYMVEDDTGKWFVRGVTFEQASNYLDQHHAQPA